MKNRIQLSVLVVLILVSTFSYAQDDVKIVMKTHSSRNFGKLNYSFKSRTERFEGHLSGIALGYSGLVSGIGNFSLPSNGSFMSQKGNSIAFDLIPYDYPIAFSKKMGFLIGIGLEVNNFKFDKDISLKQDDNGFITANDYGARGISLQKSKLTTTYLTIPFLFEVQFGKYSEIFLNFGIVGQWRMQSHTKVVANDPELNGTFKNKKGLNMTNFRYGYMAQVGCNKVGIYAKYYPESIFKKNMGPKLEQVNIGLVVYFRDFY